MSAEQRQPSDSLAAVPNSKRPSSPLLDATGAAGLLNVPKTWILAEARAGRIPHVRLGRYVRFDPDELLAWTRGSRHVGPRASGYGPGASTERAA
jgi:excisionase family DNA binding protein